MSRLEELIAELCPDGVERKTLGEIGKFYGGINGKTKDDFTDGNALFITYMNVYSNPALFLQPKETVKIADGERQKTLQYGDIIFTGSSETPDECGISSVVTEEPKERLYLNSFCFFLRPNNTSLINPNFAKHLFRSKDVRTQISKTASGVTRFNVSKRLMEKVSIPIPPLPIQNEIVRILDNFTNLIAELQAELQARKKQYEYYMTKLLIFENVPYYALEDVCEIVDYRGKTPKKASEGIFLVTAKNIRKGYIDYDKSQEFISPDDYEEVMRRGMPKIGDVLITTEAPCGNIAQIDREDIALAQRVIKYRPNEKMLDNTFLKYILLGKEFQDKLMKNATGGTVKGIKGSKLHKLTIPVPSLEVQRNVVGCLSEFEKLSNSISDGLPAEIEARQKQYEYYRNKLLTFKELGA